MTKEGDLLDEELAAFTWSSEEGSVEGAEMTAYSEDALPCMWLQASGSDEGVHNQGEVLGNQVGASTVEGSVEDVGVVVDDSVEGDALVVEDSVDGEEASRSFDLNKLPEEEEVKSEPQSYKFRGSLFRLNHMAESSRECELNIHEPLKIQAEQSHAVPLFDLNKFPDEVDDNDGPKEQERKDFIRSMLKIFFPDFY